MARVGPLVPVIKWVPLKRWTKRSPATPLPYAFHLRHWKKCSALNGIFGAVPWKRGQGYATRALGLILPEARAQGLPWVELSTDPENIASQRVIEANGGVLVERFTKLPAYGSAESLRYRITL